MECSVALTTSQLPVCLSVNHLLIICPSTILTQTIVCTKMAWILPALYTAVSPVPGQVPDTKVSIKRFEMNEWQYTILWESNDFFIYMEEVNSAQKDDLWTLTQLLKGGNKYIPQEAFLVSIEKSQASIYKMALQRNNMLYIILPNIRNLI